PGFHVNLFDDDVVTRANLGRQLFAESEIGLYKSVALVNRVNRYFGTNWKAVTKKFQRYRNGILPELAKANVFISCVDTVHARFEIAEIIRSLKAKDSRFQRDIPLYWIDLGNSRYTGQVILSTVDD